MTEKEIKTEVVLKLNQGVSKLDIYDQLKGLGDDDTLRKIIASRPTIDQKNAFKTVQLLISIIWGLFAGLELLGTVELIANFDLKYLISIIVTIYITINIWKFDGRFLLPGIIWFFLTIINSFRDTYNGYEFDPDFEFLRNITIIYTAILLIGIYLMYYLKKNVFDYYQWFQPELNDMNERKFE
ncbi:hypothetical protein [Gelidibacter pelagius]|uniref:DUF2157 domain-containing protein n=1 Tax=Gelidibacter pelagius TaxID=2819985 RepID=A0ABS3SRL3_9FLAO|nr:hypothetical protein [Gelidibacter pelagius]MBO3098355.1 hypothetical protein [Gelidibacter pelagius]